MTIWSGGAAAGFYLGTGLILAFFGAHALSRRARVARMDSCGPFLATHFLLEKQVEARGVADVMIDKKTKKMMLRIAEDYETLRGAPKNGPEMNVDDGSPLRWRRRYGLPISS